MSELMQGINMIKRAQITIDYLLKNELVKFNGESKNTWSVKLLHEDENCQMGFAYCDDPNSIDFPDHIHEDVIEYLICVRGSVMEFFNGTALRVLRVGECVAVPKGVVHRSKALEPGTILAYLCVPADKNFTRPDQFANNGTESNANPNPD